MTSPSNCSGIIIIFVNWENTQEEAGTRKYALQLRSFRWLVPSHDIECIPFSTGPCYVLYWNFFFWPDCKSWKAHPSILS